MDIFRRLTNPTLKKLYRFVLKRLVGRFLDDDIALEQLDVQLGAGRVELTDLKINVVALQELLPPGLSFRLANAHVGTLRIEISYSKLLTESLAIFLDDVQIEVSPPLSEAITASPPGASVDAEAQESGQANAAATKARREGLAAGAARPGTDATQSPLADQDQFGFGESGERLDFLAKWIEQITSKVKVVVSDLTVRITAEAQAERGHTGQPSSGGGRNSTPCLKLRCSSLKWCDETPEVSSFIADQSASTGVNRAEGPGKLNGGTAAVVHKRLTLGQVVAEFQSGQRGQKLEVVRIGGTGCVLIKQGRKPQLGSAPADVVLDVDVSLRHADITLGMDECTEVLDTAVATKPVKPLFREDFWYFEGDNDNGSGELNFDTLSGLLEQYAEARARLTEAEGYGQGVFGAGSYLSLGQSDVFYDCEEGSDDGNGGGGARADRHGSMKFRMRMTGLDITLLLPQESTGPLGGSTASASTSARYVRLQLRRLSQTLHCAGSWMHSVSEVGTYLTDWKDGNDSCVRVVEVLGAADSSPSVQISCTMGEGGEPLGEKNGADSEDVALEVRCLEVAAVLDPRLVSCLSLFLVQVELRAERADDTNGGGGNGQGVGVPSSGSTRDPRVVVAVAVPKLTVRVPADPSTCSSDAHAALIRSVQKGSSPVGWAPREEVPGDAAPMLVVEVEGVEVRLAFGASRTQQTVLECTRVACQMILVCDDGSRHGGGGGGLMKLYFLEAFRSAAETTLRVDYGLAKDIRKAGQLDLARPGDAGLNFLHTWEPNDGVESGLDDHPPSGRFSEGLQDGDCHAPEGGESPTRILLCVLPRLAVELSRLEVVVLADILGGFAPRSEGAAGASPVEDVGAAPVHSLEVVVEARGATVVLHEAAAFAEDPGPHSFVLSLGDACLRTGGGSEKSIDGSPAPLVTVLAGDVCVHENLRCSPGDRSSMSGEGRLNGPLLFLPGRDESAYPMVEDLPTLGFVPVLYQTKWVKGTSPIAAELVLGVSESGAAFKTITATLNLYDVSLRHTVASSWLPRLLGLVVGDVPAGRAVSSNCCKAGAGVGANEIGEAGGGSLTKMFITVFNGVVDYMPQSQGPGCKRMPACTPGVASGAPTTGTLPPTEGRAVFPIGVLRVSSNMVAGAPMQGFKVVIRDIGLHMSNRVTDYSKEDAGLCRGALEAQRGPVVSPMKTEFSSVQEFLESSQFVQIATLNFLDAFLRTRSHVVAPSDAFTAVELWMGIVHVYTCHDSLSTCQALLGEWWALVSEVRPAAVVPADVGNTNSPAPKRQAGRVSHGEAKQSAPKSLLDGVEQDAFLPGSSRGSSGVAQGKPPPGLMDSPRYPGQPRKQSLVIEDFYCVSVEPPPPQTGTSALQVDALDNDSLNSPPPPGQGSSFLSEGEGPAQWLAAPKIDQDHGEGLSMEMADDTSDSEGEGEGEAKAVESGPLQPVTRRSTFGFSLPAPIEIELEDRHDAGISEEKESVNLEEQGVVRPASFSPERGDLRSERADYSSQEEDDGALSPRECAEDEQELGALDMPVNMPPVPEMLPRQSSLPLGEQETSPTQAERGSAGSVPEVVYGEPAVEISAPIRTGPVQGEQEARWLGRDRESESSGVAGDGTSSSSHQAEDFRVYPHYVPIPTTAEATSLPFLSGDPLLALGHGLEKHADGEADTEGSERIDQKLQFQLAIHDLSICWRLFKGRDWVERSASEDDRTPHAGSSVGRRHQRISTRKMGDPAKGKGRRREHANDGADTSSTAGGGTKPRKAELLDALLENYQDDKGGRGEAQAGRRASRQPKVKLLKLPRESGGSSRSGRRTGRDTSCMVEVVLENSSLRLDNFHPGPPTSLLSNLLFSVKDLHASDTLTSSRPRKALHHWRDDRRHPREFQHKMVTVRMTTRSPSDHFCPEDAPLGDEVMLKVRLLPIHLSFGQHTVDFFRSFSPEVQSSPTAHEKQAAGEDPTAAAEMGAGPLFISCCDVGSFKVKIDYQPRTIKVAALQNGDYMELLNLFPLEGVHLTLQKVVLTGVSGWNGVTQLLLQSWVQDITTNQLHKFLAGTTAVRPLVTMGKGVADLVLLPVQQYRRDGRVLRGLRKGTQSFLRAITIETLHTSHRVASFVSRTLDDIVAQPGAQASLRGLEYYDEQPTGVIDSLEHAYDTLAKEVQVAAQTIIAIPYEDQEEVVGPHGRSYVRSVARALPVAVLRPVVGASEAVSCTLLGFRNYMAPVMRKEEEMRWS
ncbi:ATG2 Autophagy-related protein homolog [Ectocarpus siliculosus]|uniref:Autophagy-related protein 2 n=1 Tax=Ectocarpus siliculosus TaxID=2880 RepID=D8LE27_ECTSI|nr:ATG2 Autophagy-related protein homolog [Ectocarpus siliculosus]|eukprot:CBN78544.1 ATG2 Autophagy-related protein homolog [Ectocarpus siliculosus]